MKSQQEIDDRIKSLQGVLKRYEQSLIQKVVNLEYNQAHILEYIKASSQTMNEVKARIRLLEWIFEDE